MQWPQPHGGTAAAPPAAAAASSASFVQPPLATHGQRMRQPPLQQQVQQVQQIQQQLLARAAQQLAQQQARSTASFSLSQPQPALAAAAAGSPLSCASSQRPSAIHGQPWSNLQVPYAATAMPATSSSSGSGHRGAAGSASLRAASAAAPAAAATRPSLSKSLRDMRQMLSGAAESVAEWLWNQLRPSMLAELPPHLSASDLAARRANLLARFEEDDALALTLLVDAMHKSAKEAAAQLGFLSLPPQATAMQPTTASQRAAAAASSISVQVADDPSAGKGAAKAKLKTHLTILNALVGPEGALRMLLLSDGGSSAAVPAPPPPPWLFTLFLASNVSFTMLTRLHEALHKMPPTTSSFHLDAMFLPLHELRCHSVACDAMELVWAVVAQRHRQLQTKEHIYERMFHMCKQSKDISEIGTDAAAAAAQPRTRWSEHLQLLLPSAPQRLEMQLHIAACLHAWYGVRPSVGSLSSPSSAVAAPPSSSSQPSAEGTGSQAMDGSAASDDHAPAPAASASSSSSIAQRVSDLKAKQEAILHVIKALCGAVQIAANDASLPRQRQEKLLLLVCEVSLKLTSSRPLSPGWLLTILAHLNEHLMPLLFRAIADPSVHLQLLQIGWRMVLKMLERVASADAEEAQSMAVEIKCSGAIHAILTHCQRLTDPSKEAELMYRDGVRPRAVLPTALGLLAVLVARTAHTPFESAGPKEVEQALGQHIRRFSWERLCQDTLTSISAGSGAAACIHLTLLAHWLESYTASELFTSHPAELSTVALASLLQKAISTSSQRLDKPQLLRLCQLIIVSEQRYETCLLDHIARRSLFKACRIAGFRIADCSAAVWAWLWEATFTEAKFLQMDMLDTALLETVADEDLPAHLQRTADSIAAAGPNAIRALTRFMEGVFSPLAVQADQPYARSIRQEGVRAVTVLYFLLPRDPLRASCPESALQVMLRMQLKDALGRMLSKGWHRLGMHLDPTVASTPSPAECDEIAERTLLQLHRQLVALCAAIVRQENPADPSCTLSGFQTAMQVIAGSVLEMFQSHLPDVVADHELHLDIMQLLPLMLSYDERGALLQLSSSRSIAILQGMTAHVPTCIDLPSIDQTSLLFKASPGLVGAATEDVEEVQALQTEMQIHLLQLLARLIPAARRFNEDAESGNDLHTKVDSPSLARITNVQQLVFMLASPLLDLRGAAFTLLACFLREHLVEFDTSLDDGGNEDGAEDLTARGENGLLSRPALHLSFMDARRIMLAAQNTMQQAAQHDKPQSLAEVAINAMQLLLQFGPTEWTTPLLRLPWNGFLLRGELGRLSDPNARLSPAFLHFFTLTSADAGWAAKIRQWIRPEPILQALQRLLADGPASVETIQHALQLLQMLQSWSLLEGELVAVAQSVLVMLRECLDKLSNEESGTNRISSDQFKTVSAQIDALARELTPAASHSHSAESQDAPMETRLAKEPSNVLAEPSIESTAAAAAAASSSTEINVSAEPQRTSQRVVPLAAVPSSPSPTPMDITPDEPSKLQLQPQQLDLLSAAAAHSGMNGVSAAASGSISPTSQGERPELGTMDFNGAASHDQASAIQCNGNGPPTPAALKQDTQCEEQHQRALAPGDMAAASAVLNGSGSDGNGVGPTRTKVLIQQQHSFSAPLRIHAHALLSN